MNVEVLVKVNNDAVDKNVLCILCVLVKMIKMLKSLIDTQANFECRLMTM